MLLFLLMLIELWFADDLTLTFSKALIIEDEQALIAKVVSK